MAHAVLPAVVCPMRVERRRPRVCARCWAETELRVVADSMCWKCGGAARCGAAAGEASAIRCRRCDAEPWAAAPPVGTLRAVILELKHRPFVRDKTIELMHVWLRAAPLEASTVVVPMPLHPRRERERGFNQATVLAP